MCSPSPGNDLGFGTSLKMTLCDQSQESLKDEKDDADFKLDHHIGLSWVYCCLQICLNYIDAHICNYTLMCIYVYILYVYVCIWLRAGILRQKM